MENKRALELQSVRIEFEGRRGYDLEKFDFVELLRSAVHIVNEFRPVSVNSLDNPGRKKSKVAFSHHIF